MEWDESDVLNFKFINTKQLASFLLILTVFTLPLSTTLKSIFLPLTSIAILAQPAFYSDFIKVAREPWCKAVFLMFIIVLMGCMLGDADWKSKLSSTNKYSKLLYLPILVIAFKNQHTRYMGVHAFLFAMVITLGVSLAKVILQLPGDPGEVFHNHLTTGYFMAFAAFLSAFYSWRKSQGFLRGVYAVLAALFSFQTLFINTGRTGYVMYAILLVVLIFQCVSFRKAPFYLFLLIPLLMFTMYQSETFQYGFQTALNNVQGYQSGDKNTSVGYRLQFSQYAKKLFFSSPILGLGTAGFSYHFRKDQPIPAWGVKLNDPHNQYLLTAAEYGVVGLVILFYFFFSLFLACRKLQETRYILIGLLCSFVVANLVDSFLLLSSTGYFFILFTALSLGESFASSSELAQEDKLQVSGLTC